MTLKERVSGMGRRNGMVDSSWATVPIILGLLLARAMEICSQILSCLRLLWLNMKEAMFPLGVGRMPSQKVGVKALEVE